MMATQVTTFATDLINMPLESVEEGRTFNTSSLFREDSMRDSSKSANDEYGKQKKKKSKKRKNKKSGSKGKRVSSMTDETFDNSTVTRLTAGSTEPEADAPLWMKEQEEEWQSNHNFYSDGQSISRGWGDAQSVAVSFADDRTTATSVVTGAMSVADESLDPEKVFGKIDRKERRKRGSSSALLNGSTISQESATKTVRGQSSMSRTPMFVQISTAKVETFQDESIAMASHQSDHPGDLPSSQISRVETLAERESAAAMERGHRDANSTLMQYLASMGLDKEKAAHVAKGFTTAQEQLKRDGTVPQVASSQQKAEPPSSQPVADAFASKMREIEQHQTLQAFATASTHSSQMLSRSSSAATPVMNNKRNNQPNSSTPNNTPGMGSPSISYSTSAATQSSATSSSRTSSRREGDALNLTSARGLLAASSLDSAAATGAAAAAAAEADGPAPPTARASRQHPHRAVAGPRLTYQRFHRPGAVEMEGRAFGAPTRPETSTLTPTVQDTEDGAAFMVFDVIPVHDKSLVHAQASPMTLKNALQERPMRRLIFLGLFLVVAGVAMTLGFLLSRPKAGASASILPTEPTMAPSSAPTFINEDIYNLAASISKWSNAGPNTAQLQAVGWMSAVDDVDYDKYGGSFAQRYAMIVFYFATGGHEWLDRQSWLNPSEHECAWSPDIACTSDSTNRRFVTGLDAERNGLDGTLPSELAKLDALESLLLPKNQLKGTIPEEICLLSRLSMLDLSSNALTGSLPASIGDADYLFHFDVSENRIGGSFPESFYNLTLLRMLDVSGNQFTGSLSTDVGNFQVLDTFNIRNNSFSGRIPTETDLLLTLNYFWLDYNQFTGSFPPFTPSQAGRLEFTMSHNRMNGTIPLYASLSRFLQEAEDDVNSSGVVRWRIWKIDLSYNQFTGTINPLIALIPTLKHLDLSGNSFTGNFPGDFGWGAMEYLDIGHNKFEGTIPSGFPPSLEYYDLSENQMLGTIPPQLCFFPRLSFLKLNDNPKLNGTIPDCFGKATSLRHVELGNTNMNGVLPADLDLLTGLDIFNVSNNMLFSSIPSEFGLLSELKTMDVSRNQISGRIPTELGNLQALKFLDLSNNKLTGILPSELGRLSKIEEVKFAPGNLGLGGEIPQGLCLSDADLTAGKVGCNIVCTCCPTTTSPCQE